MLTAGHAASGKGGNGGGGKCQRSGHDGGYSACTGSGGGGGGGNAGSQYSFSADTDHVISVVNPMFSSNANLSGSDGKKGNPIEDGLEDVVAEQGQGGNPSYGYQCILGGKGGYGGDAIISSDDETWRGEAVSNSFIPAVAGRIDITWGNQ